MPRLRKIAGERRTCVPDFFSPGLTHVVSLTGSAGSEAGQPYKGGCTEAMQHSQSWAEPGIVSNLAQLILLK